MASDGMIVHTDSPKSVANQKSVMEYLLINHPLDCPVCDQAGECLLQDYSYKYGRGQSRFEEQKVKQPKKDLGPHVYLYSDRCIMCSRCVRFTREVTETSELLVEGRGNKEQIDVFPGVALDNELASNVIDLCPVGALLDKDFLFAQRVWFLRSTPSIDGITASGDNILVEHNQGQVYRIKPRTNLDINKWWITDEVRYGWKFIHSEQRLRSPMTRRFGALDECDYAKAYGDALDGLSEATDQGKLAVLVSPMLSCEEAYLLGSLAKSIDENAILGIGPVPVQGEDKVFPPSASADDPKAFVVRAEKAPNAAGVRRVLDAINKHRTAAYETMLEKIRSDEVSAVIVTGNYPSTWAEDKLLRALDGKFVIVVDTLGSDLVNEANVVLPSATWVEKAGTFENATGVIQAFEQAIPTQHMAKAEAQLALDMLTLVQGEALEAPEHPEVMIVDEQPGQVPAAVEMRLPHGHLYNAAEIREAMASEFEALSVFTTEVSMPSVSAEQQPEVELIEL